MRLWPYLSWILVVACAEGASSTPKEATRSRGEDVRSSDDEEGDDQGGMEVVDAGAARRPSSGSDKAGDAGQRRAQTGSAGTGGSKSSERERDAGAVMSAPRAEDSGAKDAGTPDSGSPEVEEPAPRAMNTGSCCSASADPGCGDSALQECVCALSPRCCSDAWDDSCARLVREKNCQSGVRDCVCGNGEGQWQQAYCCEGGWNATCESVSIHKCGATEACP